MNWRELLRNKPALYGLGAAAALGGFVLYRRMQSGETDTGAADESGDGSIGAPGYLNTTGTDVASWLGNYSASLQNQLTEYQRSLQDALDALGNVPTSPVQPVPQWPRQTGKPLPPGRRSQPRPRRRTPWPIPTPQKPSPRRWAA